MYRKSYPPAKYVFYPLYRILRRKLGLPSALAYFLVFVCSAVLHALLMLGFGHPLAALFFLLLYLGLGLAGARGIAVKNRMS